MLRMKNKTGLVTGTASGIGLAAATRLAQEGAHVRLTDMNTAQGEAATVELTRTGLSACFLRNDVTSRYDWETTLAAINAAGASLDVIANNAGIVIPGSIESIDWASWRKKLDVNLDGVSHGTQLGVCETKALGGSIINLASIEGLLGEPMAMAYNASKGAVRLLSKSSAVHCARNGIQVRINSVCPGFVETPMVLDAVGSMPPEVAQAMLTKVLARSPWKWPKLLCTWHRMSPATLRARTCSWTVATPQAEQQAGKRGAP